MSLYTPTLLTTAGNTVYLSTGNTVVTWVSLCNYSSSNVNANVFVVPSGGTPTATNIVAANVEIGAGDTFQLYMGNEKLVLGNGDTIQANVAANTAISTTVSYTSA
jgi:hypothetical protein